MSNVRNAKSMVYDVTMAHRQDALQCGHYYYYYHHQYNVLPLQKRAMVPFLPSSLVNSCWSSREVFPGSEFQTVDAVKHCGNSVMCLLKLRCQGLNCGHRLPLSFSQPLRLLSCRAVVQLVKALCYKPEGRNFDSRWDNRILPFT
jgi:hypothetical protein